MAVIKVIFVISELFLEILLKEKLLTMHIGTANGTFFLYLQLFLFIF